MIWLFGQYHFGETGIIGFSAQTYPCWFYLTEAPQAANED